MRQISRNIDKRTRFGSVKLEAHDSEDMWHLYNLLSAGDTLQASTIRKVQQESTTGTSSSERLRLNLTITVDSIDFDSSTVSIRASGPVCEENVHVRIGAFHTLDLERHRALTLTKQSWDTIFLERLDFALDPSTDAEVGAVIMEEGLAHVLLITRSLTITRARIEKPIPRKGANAIYNRETVMKSFFEAVMRAIVEHFDWNLLKAVLVASPGYCKDEFYKYLMLHAARQDLNQVLENKSKIILCHSSSGHKHALDEVLQRKEVQARLSKTKAILEIQLLGQFNEIMKKDETRATYGPPFVQHATSMGAVEKLLITDTLFRSSDVKQREKYVALTEEVKQNGGSVFVFSTQHVSGEQLNMMSGIAAILRFPLPDLDNVEPSDTL